ncbi:dGTP triphosphohydrolase [Mariniblastus fucicola]|uniref:Deoxyguanosinetriphosphate triphosphohydrolase-like protein n=1 Tax=Mariniblastus fucicola TaxID=980251 RepID=A0A5B9PHJ9_9BACT|nr:dNTP triphosphohydrolase [Mariniblastus fucicola]QEG24745.1 Deoxyguanosinetriphosphate triphosphohydrolase [Mariniblastus fucicola]
MTDHNKPSSTSNGGDDSLSWVEEREKTLLAPWAMRSCDSAGRKYPQEEHSYRGPYQRDRDRILHSSAYRRLSGKMQVFTGEMGDYHRTRLTHTQEVATIARTIGRVLGLNEDLIEALALMHDIGHPPYGHAGEDALHECIADEGGFSHNQFALTIAEEIEIRYQEFPGLNLTYEVLAGQQKRIDKTKTDGPRPLLEVQLVDAADSTTYDAHDTDDAVKLKLVTIEEMSSVQLIRDALKRVRDKYTNLNDDLTRKAIVHQLVERQVTSLISHCAGQLQDRAFASATEAMNSDFLIEHPTELAEQKRELEAFLYRNVYRHPDLIAIRQRAQQRLKEMFAKYCERPELFPEKYQQRSEKTGVRRMAVEYIAGMTDHFCEQTYSRICQ